MRNDLERVELVYSEADIRWITQLFSHLPRALVLREQQFESQALAPIVDSSRVRTSLTGLLKERFGLSSAELKLALALTAGATLNAVSAAENTSVLTLRTQLKSIFSKTNTHRQAELIRLVLSLSQS